MKSTVLLEIAMTTMEQKTRMLHDLMHRKEAFESKRYHSTYIRNKLADLSEEIENLKGLNESLHTYIQKKINK